MANEPLEYLDRAQKAWAKKVEKLLADMPAGLELLVGDGSIEVHPAGFWSREIYDAGIDMMFAGGVISDASLHSISIDRNRIRPNSESI